MHHLNEFEIFCLYHLGLADAQAGVPLNLNQLAGRLGVSFEYITEFLEKHHLAAEHVLNSGFDLVGAQLDLQFAPEGVHLESVARRHFADYKNLLSIKQ